MVSGMGESEGTAPIWLLGFIPLKNIIDAGYYRWDFRIKVDGALPPTFKDDYGDIHYLIYAYISPTDHSEGILISRVAARHFL